MGIGGSVSAFVLSNGCGGGVREHLSLCVFFFFFGDSAGPHPSLLSLLSMSCGEEGGLWQEAIFQNSQRGDF